MSLSLIVDRRALKQPEMQLLLRQRTLGRQEQTSIIPMLFQGREVVTVARWAEGVTTSSSPQGRSRRNCLPISGVIPGVWA
jgi:hypothetical protein